MYLKDFVNFFIMNNCRCNEGFIGVNFGRIDYFVYGRFGRVIGK